MTLYELDGKTLRVTASRNLANFRASILVAKGDTLFIGGDALAECSMHGTPLLRALRGPARPNCYGRTTIHFGVLYGAWQSSGIS